MRFIMIVLSVLLTACSTASKHDTVTHIVFPIADGGGEIRLPVDHWQRKTMKTLKGKDNTYHQLTDPQTKIQLSVTIHANAPCATAAECQKLWWTRARTELTQPRAIEHFQTKEYAVSRFLILREHGQAVNQLNYVAHAVYQGNWVIARVSKLFAGGEDSRQMTAVIDALTYVQTAASE